MELPGYFDVVNELNFAFFIGKTSASLGRIFRTVGDDVTHLMDAILFQVRVAYKRANERKRKRAAQLPLLFVP